MEYSDMSHFVPNQHHTPPNTIHLDNLDKVAPVPADEEKETEPHMKKI
jgi:hypothetical protein